MKWFGESWGAPVCVPELFIKTPAGFLCSYCEEAIKEEDRGFALPFAHVDPVDVIQLMLRKGQSYLVCHRRCLTKELTGEQE